LVIGINQAWIDNQTRAIKAAEYEGMVSFNSIAPGAAFHPSITFGGS